MNVFIFYMLHLVHKLIFGYSSISDHDKIKLILIIGFICDLLCIGFNISTKLYCGILFTLAVYDSETTCIPVIMLDTMLLISVLIFFFNNPNINKLVFILMVSFLFVVLYLLLNSFIGFGDIYLFVSILFFMCSFCDNYVYRFYYFILISQLLQLVMCIISYILKRGTKEIAMFPSALISFLLVIGGVCI